MHGVGGDEEKKLRKFAAPWDENGVLIITNKSYTESGSPIYEYINLSSYLPHGIIANAVLKAINGEKPNDKIFGAFAEIVEPFVSEDIFTQFIDEVKHNRKKSGGYVWDTNESPEIQTKQFIEYMALKVGPGVLTSASNIYRGAIKKETFFKKYNLETEVIASLSGFRINQVNVEKSLESKLFNFKKEQQDILRGINKRSLEKSKKAEKNLYEEMYDYIQYAKTLGVSYITIKKLLDDGRFGSKEAKASLLSGAFPRYLDTVYANREKKKAD
jgi:hypothetical protein